MRICLSIFAEDSLENMDRIVNISKIFNEIFIEIRLDNIFESFNLNKIKDLKEHLILTIRSREENVYNRDMYYAYLKLISFKPSYVDIDFRSSVFHKVADAAHKNNVKVIGSYHNFNETPSFKELELILSSIIDSGDADVVKIVTYANEYRDNLVVFNLLSKYACSYPLTAFCMGKKGVISRIASPLFGSYLTYASLDDKATALGQIPLNDFLRIMEVLL